MLASWREDPALRPSFMEMEQLLRGLAGEQVDEMPGVSLDSYADGETAL